MSRITALLTMLAIGIALSRAAIAEPPADKAKKAKQEKLAADEKEVEELERKLAEAKARNEKLKKKIQTLLQELDRLQDGSAKPRRKPPKDDVKGKVTAIDPKTGQVTVSVKKDARLMKGHTLEVFRFKPKPLYVGTLEIVEVGKNKVICKLRSAKAGATVQVDDEITGDLLRAK